MTSKYAPDTVSPPGETLQELLDDRGITQRELAIRTGYTPKHVNKVIKGEDRISPEFALALERVLSVPQNFWSARDARYQDYKAKLVETAQLKEQTKWLANFPISQMINYGYIEKKKDRIEQLEELLNFLGIASPGRWDSWWSKRRVAFRISSQKQPDQYALAAWLRQGELVSQRIKSEEFDSNSFHDFLRTMARELTLAPLNQVASELPELCAQSGVRMCFVRELRNTHVSGAARWVNNYPVIQMSLRYKRNDVFWFAFFHEACHILKHGKHIHLQDNSFDNEDPLEREANNFAADLLIPPKQYRDFVQQPISRNAIIVFAKDIGIAPGIVLGRLQHDKLVAYSKFNELKRKYEWNDVDSLSA